MSEEKVVDPIKISKVIHDGNVGEFRGNGEVIGWKGEDGMVIHSVENVQQAAWFEGELRIAIEGGDVMRLTGFRPQDFETLWQHFADFNVHIKKHTRTTTLTKDDFDGALENLSKHADLVDASKSGSVLKKSKEFNLLTAVEAMRDGLEEAVKGDKNVLSNVFAANNCERIGKLRLIINTVQLEVYHTDQRWVHLRNMAFTIQSVLQELGTFVRWRPPGYEEHSDGDSGMSKRQMMWELKCKQNPDLNPDDFDAEVHILESPTKTRPVKSAATNPLANPLAGGGIDILAGLKKAQQQQPLQTFRPGEYVEGKYGDGHWYDATVMTCYDDGTYEIRWQDGATDDTRKTPNDLRKKEGGGYVNPELPKPPAPVPAVEEDEGSGEDATVDSGKQEEIQTERPDLEPVTPIEERKKKEKGENKRMYYIRQDSIIEGWVWKRSRFLKYWRRRWLVLTNSGLESYKERSQYSKATEYIDRNACQRVYNADGEVSMARCFCVCTKWRNFYMVCDDEAQKSEWLRLIQQNLGGRW